MFDPALTKSYIRVCGKKIYCNNSYNDIDAQMHDNTDYIEVTASQITGLGRKETFKKSVVNGWGKIF